MTPCDDVAGTQLDTQSAADGDSPETYPSPDQSTSSDRGCNQSDATPPAYEFSGLSSINKPTQCGHTGKGFSLFVP